jgi:hypothetical protein
VGPRDHLPRYLSSPLDVYSTRLRYRRGEQRGEGLSTAVVPTWSSLASKSMASRVGKHHRAPRLFEEGRGRGLR